MIPQMFTMDTNTRTLSKHFQISLIVTEDVLDEANHVNNVEYLRWVQEVSQRHWRSKVSEETIKKYAWVAMDHHIQQFLMRQLLAIDRD